MRRTGPRASIRHVVSTRFGPIRRRSTRFHSTRGGLQDHGQESRRTESRQGRDEGRHHQRDCGEDKAGEEGSRQASSRRSGDLVAKELGKKGPGIFVLPGLLKLKVVRKPATKAKQGVNPFTKEPMTIKAKPARNVVRAVALKSLKELV